MVVFRDDIVAVVEESMVVSSVVVVAASQSCEEGKKDFDPFPSLVISSDGIQAKGSYAEAQVRIKVFKFPSY